MINSNETVPIVPVDLRPLPKEPESEKKKTIKVKVPQRKNNERSDKPNISYPTNFEHTVHVGFDAITGEFTVIHYFYVCLHVYHKFLIPLECDSSLRNAWYKPVY